jgi:MinD-like ATPase involved in chromosome partitioning or flagellar assembly
MTGTVVTFYSYKGGVGRSFALANIAVLLARWGHSVLTIDWDLEAPGLHAYFSPFLSDQPDVGIVDLVDDFADDISRSALDYVTKLDAGESAALDLLAAGRQDSTYPGKVQAIDWAAMYDRGFAEVLERCREEWTDEYDFVLIDSRTGYADVASICTAHLPDRLVVLFTANDQSVGGAVNVAARADDARDRMPYDRSQLTVLPVLSRFDGRVEYERAENWHRTCADLAAPLFDNWLVKNVPGQDMLRHLTLPYVSYWSFGEQLPVRAERTPSADQIAFALETVAAVIAHQFDRTDLLADNRDDYVTAARAQARDFKLDLLVSCPRSALGLATSIVSELRTLGVRAEPSLSGDVDFLGKGQDLARHLCLLVDRQVSRWQTAEAERFLRRTLTLDGYRRLIPVLTEATEPLALPGFLRNLQHLSADAGPREVAALVHAQLTGAEPPVRPENPHREAALALRQLTERNLQYNRWFLVEQIVDSLTTALHDNDTDGLRDLTIDLGLAARVSGADDRTAIPAKLRELINELTSRLDYRARRY